MNLTILIAFLFLLYSCFNEFYYGKETHRRISCILPLVVTFFPVGVGFYEFFTSPRPMLERFKYGVMTLIYGNAYDEIEAREKLKENGNPIYCNPFKNSETFCNHTYKVSLLNCTEQKTARETGVGVVEMLRYTMRPDRFLISTSNFIKEGPSLWSETNIDLGEITVRVKVNLNKTECFLELTNMRYNIKEESGPFEYVKERVEYFFDFLSDCGSLDRLCCFCIEEGSLYMSGRGRLICHCESITNVFKKTGDGYQFYSYSVSSVNGGDDMCICLGTRCKIKSIISGEEDTAYEMIFRNKYGDKFLKIFLKYLEIKYPTRKRGVVKRMCFIERADNYDRMKEEYGMMGSWQFKRLNCDFSYMREKVGSTALYNTDKKINPSLLIQKLCVDLDQRDRVNFSPHFVKLSEPKNTKGSGGDERGTKSGQKVRMNVILNSNTGNPKVVKRPVKKSPGVLREDTSFYLRKGGKKGEESVSSYLDVVRRKDNEYYRGVMSGRVKIKIGNPEAGYKCALIKDFKDKADQKKFAIKEVTQERPNGSRAELGGLTPKAERWVHVTGNRRKKDSAKENNNCKKHGGLKKTENNISLAASYCVWSELSKIGDIEIIHGDRGVPRIKESFKGVGVSYEEDPGIGEGNGKRGERKKDDGNKNINKSKDKSKGKNKNKNKNKNKTRNEIKDGNRGVRGGTSFEGVHEKSRVENESKMEEGVKFIESLKEMNMRLKMSLRIIKLNRVVGLIHRTSRLMSKEEEETRKTKGVKRKDRTSVKDEIDFTFLFDRVGRESKRVRYFGEFKEERIKGKEEKEEKGGQIIEDLEGSKNDNEGSKNDNEGSSKDSVTEVFETKAERKERIKRESKERKRAQRKDQKAQNENRRILKSRRKLLEEYYDSDETDLYD